MSQSVTEVFRAMVPSVGLVLKARADIGGKLNAYCSLFRFRDTGPQGVVPRARALVEVWEGGG